LGSFTSDNLIYVSILLNFCQYNTSSCIVNDEFYKSIREKYEDIYLSVYFFPTHSLIQIILRTLLNFHLMVISLSFNTTQSNLFVLNQVELITHNPTNFTTLTTESHFSSKTDVDNLLKTTNIVLLQFGIYFNPNYFTKIIYTRSYKSFSAALAGTFSIIKLYMLDFGFINNAYCENQLESDIIDRCFDYNKAVKVKDSGYQHCKRPSS
jgi:hypothetical protein